MSTAFHLDGYETVRVKEYPDKRAITLKPKVELLLSPCCNVDVLKNGTMDQIYRDINYAHQAVGLKIIRQKYLCSECRKSYVQEIPGISTDYRCTSRLVSHVRYKLINQNGAFRTVGKELSLNYNTVISIFKDYAIEIAEQFQFDIPEVLGIDEVSIKGIPRCVLTDIEGKEVIDMLENRNSTTLEEYFSKIDPQKLAEIRVVAMDMWRPYRTIARKYMPQAVVVVDKFHVLRMANIAMEKIRIMLSRGATKETREYLKNNRFYLLGRYHTNLNDPKLKKLAEIKEHFPNLYEAYELKEEFFEIWSSKDKQEAIQRHETWLAKIMANSLMNEVYAPLLTAMTNNRKHWYNEIFNYFDHKHTNAFTESANNIIAGVRKQGRNTSFELVRFIVLYTQVRFQTQSTQVKFTKEDF